MVSISDNQDRMLGLHSVNSIRVYEPRETRELTSVSKPQVEWLGCTNKISIERRNH